MSYAVFSHFFTSASISFTDVISIRCVMRSFFCQSAGIDEPFGNFRVLERQSQVDSRARGGLDLRENVVAIERHDCFARANFYVLAQAASQRQKFFINWPQRLFRS